MNVLHMKYAVEVANNGSLNKAAEKLYIAQPNLSRAIKELEASLGITIFDRSAKGMVMTPAGEEFINYAKNILKQIDEVELIYKQGSPKIKNSPSLCHALATYPTPLPNSPRTSRAVWRRSSTRKPTPREPSTTY